MPSASEPLLPLADIFARIPSTREAIVHGGERWSLAA